VPIFFAFPVLIGFVPGGLPVEAWYSLPAWSRFVLVWFSAMITFQFHIRRPY
jgi:hypothetical protein